MPRPRLDRADASAIAYSIGTWSASGHALRDHSPATQGRRARRSAEVRYAASVDRARRIVAMLDAGATMRATAAALDVSLGTVHGARRRMFNVPVRYVRAFVVSRVLGGDLLDLLNQPVQAADQTSPGE